jgi:hypothetical protein
MRREPDIATVPYFSKLRLQTHASRAGGLPLSSKEPPRLFGVVIRWDIGELPEGIILRPTSSVAIASIADSLTTGRHAEPRSRDGAVVAIVDLTHLVTLKLEPTAFSAVFLDESHDNEK